MLQFDEALARLLSLARPLGPERVALDDADGRVLFADTFATEDAPASDVSAMDGYAVASADLARAPVILPVVGEAKPGDPSDGVLAPATTLRIFTGARLPAGADAVVIQEDVVRSGDDARFTKPVRPHANVRLKGEDLARGSIALARGTRLSPAKVGFLASLDAAWAIVSRRPIVTVLSTGDELRSPGSPKLAGSDGGVAESGSVTVRAMAKRAGAHAAVHPLVKDDLAATKAAIEASLRSSDLVVTIGGMSEGDFDLVRPALAELGVSLEFWKVAIKPGKPLGVGTRGPTVVLGLPGNPAAAVVTFGLFGVPFLRALAGETAAVPSPLRARSTVDIEHKPGRLDFLRGRLSREEGALLATPLAHQSSGSVASVGRADALLLIPRESPGVVKGAEVDVIPFEDLGA